MSIKALALYSMAGLPDSSKGEINTNIFKREMSATLTEDGINLALKSFSKEIAFTTGAVKSMVNGRPRLKINNADERSKFSMDGSINDSGWLIMGMRVRFGKDTPTGTIATAYSDKYYDYKLSFKGDTDYYIEVMFKITSSSAGRLELFVNNESKGVTQVTLVKDTSPSIRLGVNCTSPFIVNNTAPMDVWVSDVYAMTATSNLDRLGPIFVEEQPLDIPGDLNGWSFSTPGDDEKTAIKDYLSKPRPEIDPFTPNVISDGRGRPLEIDFSAPNDSEIIAATCDVGVWRDESSGAKLLVSENLSSVQTPNKTVIPSGIGSLSLGSYHRNILLRDLPTYKLILRNDDS